MKKITVAFLLLMAIFAQSQKPKLVVSVSGELNIDLADVLADEISYAIMKSGKYEPIANDRQFKNALKKEWENNNVNDDRIIALAKESNADYICFAKIKSVLGSNQITAQLFDLKTESKPKLYSMGKANGKLSGLDDFTEISQKVVAEMLSFASSIGGDDNTFTDPRDEQQYKTVKIGGYTWMAENLNYGASGSKCYENNSENCAKYGRLYDWGTATKKACPSGWHLPSDNEYSALASAVGGGEVAGEKLKAKSGWDWNYDDNISGNGTDDYGFSALPGGNGGKYGSFSSVGSYGGWWSASESAREAYGLNLTYWSMDRKGELFGRPSSRDYESKYSVRCLQDYVAPPPEPAKSSDVLSSAGGVLTDSRDGKKYKTVKIGNQTWMAENMNYEAGTSACYNKDNANCQKYGRLYNWSTAKQICPNGWHLPSKDEWDALNNAVGGASSAGWVLKSKSGWNKNGNGVDKYGFSALPGGFGDLFGSFNNVGYRGYWWSASEFNSGHAYYRGMYYYYEYAHWSGYNKASLFSVRCLQD